MSIRLFMEHKVKMHTVCIGMITFLRPRMLKQALQSLIDMKQPSGCTLNFVMADNDPQGSAKSLFDWFKESVPFECYYFIVAKRGIPFARNRVLKEALNLGCSEIAFFDDDEVVDHDWLVNLFGFYTEKGCDIAVGPVKAVLPYNAPSWIREGNFFDRPEYPEGSTVSMAATNNVIYAANIFSQLKLCYNEEFALTGGTDTFLSREAIKAGCVIKWTNRAVVYESVSESRLNLLWILKRNYRTGSVLGAAIRMQKKEGRAVWHCLRSAGGAFLYGIGYSIGGAVTFSRVQLFRGLILLAQAAGRFFSMFGLFYKEYQVVHGD